MATIKYTIAIMDEESKERDKFVNFFEKEFNVVEIPFVAEIDQLVNIIKSEKIDAIAIDYKLREHKSKFTQNGDYFFKQLLSRLQDFPSFVLTQDAEKARKETKLIKPRFIVDKVILHSPDKEAVKEFKEEIKQEIKTFKSIFNEKLKRLRELEKVRKKGELNDETENEFLQLNNEVSQSLTGHESLPLKYFSQETNRKLDDVISKTDELIKKMSKKK